MTGSKKRILLIGGGDYAQSAHWPAFANNPHAELVGIVDLNSQKTRIGRLWPDVSFHGVPDECNGREDTGNEHTSSVAIPDLEKRPELAPDKIDGAIVSTYGAHYEYVLWALERGWHVLVDKPLTTSPGMVTDADQARRLIQHFDRLTELARDKGLLLSLATQRRFSSIYLEIARELRDAAKWMKSSDPSRGHVRSVQAFTSDGYFKPSWGYRFGAFGGKVKNTGYHVVDIVTWLLRQVTQGIDSAVIQVSPLCIDGLARLAREERPGLSPSELYASVQITFMIGNASYCVFQFHAQHENFALSAEHTGRRPHLGALNDEETLRAFQNRTKEEELRIALGPFFRVYFRRVAKVLDKPGCESGAKLNSYLEFSRSYPGVEPGRVFQAQTLPYDDPDWAPADEFLRELFKDKPSSAAMRSPVEDHAAAVSVFSGIYQGIALARNGSFEPVTVDLRGKWFPPTTTS